MFFRSTDDRYRIGSDRSTNGSSTAPTATRETSWFSNAYRTGSRSLPPLSATRSVCRRGRTSNRSTRHAAIVVDESEPGVSRLTYEQRIEFLAAVLERHDWGDYFDRASAHNLHCDTGR